MEPTGRPPRTVNVSPVYATMPLLPGLALPARALGPRVDGRRAVLTVSTPPGRGPIAGAVLVLAGGRSTSLQPASPIQLPVLRMLAFARASAEQARRSSLRLALARLRYRVRGWNGRRQDPVVDAHWALDWLADRLGSAPVALIGHSMGARTAMAVAGMPTVRAAVGLAPWLGTDDPVDQVAGRRILIMHGTADQTTDPAASRAWTVRASRVAESASYVAVSGAGHAMLQRQRLWHQLSSRYAVAAIAAVATKTGAVRTTTTGQDAYQPETDADAVATVLARALNGVPFSQI